MSGEPITTKPGRPTSTGDADRERVWSELGQLGLLSHAAELDVHGFTVLPPEVVQAGALVDRMREAALGLVGDLTEPDHGEARGRSVGHIVCRDEAFEEAVLTPAPLALLTYLLGYSCKLHLTAVAAKVAGVPRLPLHADNPPWQPDPWPTYSQVANATWLLSDYSRENGAICFIAGSHRLCRRPTSAEAENFDHEGLITVEAPAGSVVVWHGHTWHGAHPRVTPGVRLSAIIAAARPYMQVQHNYRELVTDSSLDRHGPRFRTLMGLDDPAPYGLEGPSPRVTPGAIFNGGRTLFS